MALFYSGANVFKETDLSILVVNVYHQAEFRLSHEDIEQLKTTVLQ